MLPPLVPPRSEAKISTVSPTIKPLPRARGITTMLTAFLAALHIIVARKSFPEKEGVVVVARMP